MSWNQFDRSVEKGPMSFGIFVILLVTGLVIVAGTIGWGLGWFGEAAQVAQEQFGARAGLQKYEWFVEQASAINKMDQDVVNFRKRLASIDESYAGYGSNKSAWQPHIQMQYNKEHSTAQDDLLAVISQRNNLVREYNAASSKFNWALFNTKADKPSERFEELVQ